MQPIDSVHLLDKSTLANHRSDQVQCEYGGIIPVPGHHVPDGEFFGSQASVWKILDPLFDYLSDVIH